MATHKVDPEDPHRCICGAEWEYDDDWDGCAYFATLTPLSIKDGPMRYHGGPHDGEDFTEGTPLAPVVERVVGFLDLTPEGVVTPVRKVSVTARYRWGGGDRLDFEEVRAKYRVIDL